jgi:hypothetical protein
MTVGLADVATLEGAGTAVCRAIAAPALRLNAAKVASTKVFVFVIVVLLFQLATHRLGGLLTRKIDGLVGCRVENASLGWPGL